MKFFGIIATSVLVSSSSALHLRGDPLTENCACGVCPGEDPTAPMCMAYMPCSASEFAKECVRRELLKKGAVPGTTASNSAAVLEKDFSSLAHAFLQQRARTRTNVQIAEFAGATAGKTSAKCGIIDAACDIVLSGGATVTSEAACIADDAAVAAACEAAGAGPEDPFADACAVALATAFEVSCKAAVEAGGHFDASACKKSSGC